MTEIKRTKLAVVASYGGETQGCWRFKVDAQGVSLRLYRRKEKEIPDEVVIDLREWKKRVDG